jgi:hypothetical protein
VLSVRGGLRSIRLKVIDPKSGRLLTWSQVKARAQAPSLRSTEAQVGFDAG